MRKTLCLVLMNLTPDKLFFSSMNCTEGLKIDGKLMGFSTGKTNNLGGKNLVYGFGTNGYVEVLDLNDTSIVSYVGMFESVDDLIKNGTTSIKKSYPRKDSNFFYNAWV